MAAMKEQAKDRPSPFFARPIYALCGLRAVASSEFETAASNLASSGLNVTTIHGCIIKSEAPLPGYPPPRR